MILILVGRTHLTMYNMYDNFNSFIIEANESPSVDQVWW